MAVIPTRTKAQLGWKAAKLAARNPKATLRGARAMRPLAKLIITHSPQLARELGLIGRPTYKRTIPRVALGAVIGAGAVYLLDPENGPQHRRQLTELVG